MSDDQQPYEPPRSNVRDIVTTRPRPVFGIVMGAVVDIGGTIIAGIVLFILASVQLSSEGLTPEQIVATLTAMPLTSALSIAATLFGLLFSVLGGYVCASYAKKDIYGCAVILGIGVCVLGALLGGSQSSVLVDLLMYLITIAAVIFGAWIYGRNHVWDER